MTYPPIRKRGPQFSCKNRGEWVKEQKRRVRRRRLRAAGGPRRGPQDAGPGMGRAAEPGAWREDKSRAEPEGGPGGREETVLPEGHATGKPPTAAEGKRRAAARGQPEKLLQPRRLPPEQGPAHRRRRGKGLFGSEQRTPDQARRRGVAPAGPRKIRRHKKRPIQRVLKNLR